jgi:hypothetical protein
VAGHPRLNSQQESSAATRQFLPAAFFVTDKHYVV